MSKKPTYKELEQKVSELTHRNNKFDELFHSLPQIIVETDLKGNLTYANQKTFESTGYTIEDFNNGLNATQFVIPEERPIVAENMQRVINGKKLHGNEYTGLRKDGTTFPVLVYSSYKIENGEKSGIRSIIINNSERKKEELIKEALIEKLQKAADEIKSLQGIIPICMLCKQIRDDKGFWNKVEHYIEQHTGAQISHGICPDCYPKYKEKLIK